MKNVTYLSVLILSLVLICTSCTKKDDVAPTQPVKSTKTAAKISTQPAPNSLQAKFPDWANLTWIPAGYTLDSISKLYITIVGDTLTQTQWSRSNSGFKSVVNKFTAIILTETTVEFQDTLSKNSDGYAHIAKTDWYYWKTDSTIKLNKSNDPNNSRYYLLKINR
jgi:hypothetical protein